LPSITPPPPSPTSSPAPGRAARRPVPGLRLPLSPREVQVLVGIANGRSNKQIARELQLSVDTVKTHLRRLYSRMGARDRAHAVAIADRRAILSRADVPLEG
jgi:DNA-binding NarL/FixJ family response regulator